MLKTIKSIFSITLLSFVTTNCSPKVSGLSVKTNAEKPINTEIKKPQQKPTIYELTPTYVPFVGSKVKYTDKNNSETTTSNEAKSAIEKTYEKPIKKIKNKQAVINLDSVSMSKVLMSYDPSQRKLSIQGHTQILSEDKKVVAETDFVVSGQHSIVDVTFSLKSDESSKINSREKPVVGAKVTCLAYDENDQTNCASVIIDFLIAYKKQIYSEQMEVKRDLTKTNPEIKTEPPPQLTPPKTTLPEPISAEALQKEGEEDSVLGRYEGQTETADLTEVFEKDDEIQTVLKVDDPKTKDAKIDVKVTDHIQQTKNGDLRPTNQAIGIPNAGTLRNATSMIVRQSLLNKNAFYEIVYPDRQRFYATYEMAEMITRLGLRLNEQMDKKLAVSDISKLKGGLISPHLSHQTGLDADIGYPTEDKVKFPVVVQMSTRSYNRAVYSVEKTYDLFKFAFKQPDIKIARIFVDRIIKQALCQYAKSKGEFQSEDKVLVQTMFKNIDHVSGHGDHFHIRLKCSSADPACRNREYQENNGCQ